MSQVEPIIGYMCKIDWDHELGEASAGTPIYPSLADLQHDHPCWVSCGIVKVCVTHVATLRETDFEARLTPEELREIEMLEN